MSDAKIKRKLKYDVVTPAMEIFHDKQMVVERPEGMTYEEYKIMRRIQTEVLKKVVHHAGPKTFTKRLKYSRKKLIDVKPPENKVSDGNSGEVSQHV